MRATIRCELFLQDARTLRDALRAAARRGVFDWTPGAYGTILCRPWVARIDGGCAKYGLMRDFIPPKRDYSEATDVGSRGICHWYVLESGHYYEVYRQVTWRATERFFCRVTDDGEIERVDREEVEAWASGH